MSTTVSWIVKGWANVNVISGTSQNTLKGYKWPYADGYFDVFSHFLINFQGTVQPVEFYCNNENINISLSAAVTVGSKWYFRPFRIQHHVEQIFGNVKRG